MNDVLLALNDRDEWELLGGRPGCDEDPRLALSREIQEESGLVVQVSEAPLDAYQFRVLGHDGPLVFVVTYGTEEVTDNAAWEVSTEHLMLRRFSVSEAIELENLPAGYKNSIRRQFGLD